jgi:thiamine-monophosphate kinase
MKEFDLIKQYFANQGLTRKDVILGIGDDCAILQAGERQHIAVTTDTLVEGVHFPANTSAKSIGHKVVAVSLSDLAAVGAEPSWISLAITLPKIEESWVKEFCEGVFDLCEFYNVQLVGGDTTQGPLSVTVTAQGLTPAGKHLSRSGAKAGDWLYVTGEIGDAALALQYILGNIQNELDGQKLVQHKLDFPKPRVLAGQALRDLATSAIDISDGLLSDLEHICDRSGVGATINLEDLPISTILYDTLGTDAAAELALNGGDDYELLFTVSQDNRVGMETALAHTGVTVTCIGQINGSDKITTLREGKTVEMSSQGYQHFEHA